MEIKGIICFFQKNKNKSYSCECAENKIPITTLKDETAHIQYESENEMILILDNNDVGDANFITWNVRGGRISHGQGTRSISVEVATKSGPFSVSVTKRNDCGSMSFSEIGAINPDAAIKSISFFPNPATDVVALKLTEPNDGVLSPQGQSILTTKGVTSTYEIQLWNGLTMLKSFKTNQLTFQIPIVGLPTGLYFVRVIKDGQTYTEKLIKN